MEVAEVDLKELGSVNPEKHWYYQSKLAFVHSQISKFAPNPSSIIDIGAGSGFFSGALSKKLKVARVVCIDTNYEVDSFNSDTNTTFTRKSEPQNGDIYLLMDVLEHVEDDLALLKQSLAAAERDALVVITVPAFNSMWSSHDDHLGHFRRYKLDEVIALTKAAGLEVLSGQYIFSAIFLPAWIVRKFRSKIPNRSDMKPANVFLNRFLEVVCAIEGHLPRNHLFGLSVLVVAVTKTS
jgi:2-polyprenyl-3-methyl-5-hydroxy-6-metoxy-1,4-benzoquinol methylase